VCVSILIDIHEFKEMKRERERGWERKRQQAGWLTE